jgi:tripeptidyl-peptidase-1
MAGSNYVVVIGGDEYLLSGTSASAPVAAGLVSLVNSQRLAAGKSSLGFLNQAIYQNGDIFNDITSGENNCCAGDSDQVCCDEGFYATTSWDPLTGFGSIDFQKFSDVFSNFA